MNNQERAHQVITQAVEILMPGNEITHTPEHSSYNTHGLVDGFSVYITTHYKDDKRAGNLDIDIYDNEFNRVASVNACAYIAVMLAKQAMEIDSSVKAVA